MKKKGWGLSHRPGEAKAFLFPLPGFREQGPGVLPGREPGEHCRLGGSPWRCESASLIKGRYDPVCKIKNPLTGRGDDTQEGKVRMDCLGRWRFQDWPYILAKSRSAAVSCKSCTAVWNLLSCSYRGKSPPIPCFLNAPSPVLCKQPKSALIAGLPLTAPLGRNLGSVRSTLRIQVASSQVCSHQPPQALLPWVLLATLRPGSKSHPPPTSSSPRGQPTSGRAWWKCKIGKPWPVPLVSTHHDVPLGFVNVNMVNISLLHHFLWDKGCQPILIVGGIFQNTVPLELWDNRAQNSRIQILHPWGLNGGGEGSRFSEIKWFFSFSDTELGAIFHLCCRTLWILTLRAHKWKWCS